MKVLLTGGTGFLGSYIYKELLDRGHEPVILARSPGAGQYLTALGLADARREALAPDYSNLGAIVESHAPDVVIHVAAHSRGGESDEDLRQYIDSNVVMGSLLLNAMRERAVSAFVNCGTSWQYGNDGNYEPFNFYAATKQAFEDIIRHYCMDGMRSITLRVYDTFGPFDNRNRILDLLIDAALSRNPLKMSPGEQKIHFVDVRDVASAFVLAAERAAALPRCAQEVYGVISEAPVPLKSAAEVVGDVLGLAPPIEFGGRPYREREVMDPYSGCDTVPGWVPQRSLRDTLREVIDLRLSKSSVA